MWKQWFWYTHNKTLCCAIALSKILPVSKDSKHQVSKDGSHQQRKFCNVDFPCWVTHQTPLWRQINTGISPKTCMLGKRWRFWEWDTLSIDYHCPLGLNDFWGIIITQNTGMWKGYMSLCLSLFSSVTETLHSSSRRIPRGQTMQCLPPRRQVVTDRSFT